MPATYDSIATTTLGSAQTSVTFSSIPQTYTDLVFVLNTNGTSAGSEPNIYINNDSNANYNRTYLFGNGSSANAGRNTGITAAVVGSSGSANDFTITHFNNYSNTSVYKTVLASGGGVSNELKFQVTMWLSTTAITSLVVRAGTGVNFNSGTTMTLYGIKAA